MSKWTEAASLLKKIITANEVTPLRSDLIELQSAMFTLQADQMKLLDDNRDLREKLATLKKLQDYQFAPGFDYFIGEDRPDIHLCPVHTKKSGVAHPLVAGEDFCNECKRSYGRTA